MSSSKATGPGPSRPCGASAARNRPTTGRPGRIVLPALDGARTLTEALRRLDTAGVAPEDVALHKPTLDEVFLALTGHLASTVNRNGHDTRGGAGRGDHHHRERADR
ncbi:MAG TPA: hypothetical protein VG276_07085 [Actinomycetes bacterium]|nr:hypothetical protein [Actinomycetes bacterium]